MIGQESNYCEWIPDKVPSGLNTLRLCQFSVVDPTGTGVCFSPDFVKMTRKLTGKKLVLRFACLRT